MRKKISKKEMLKKRGKKRKIIENKKAKPTEKKKAKAFTNLKEKEGAQFMYRGIKMKVVGIGGGGSTIVSEIAPKLTRVKFLVSNTDAQALKIASRTTERFQFGQKHTHGLGTGMNPHVAEQAAEEEKERIKRIFQDQDLSVIVSTLGGGVGSGAAPVFTKLAKDQKNLTFGIFTFPFKFEGEKRWEIARDYLEKLKPNLNAYAILPNEKIFSIIDPQTPLKESLTAMNKILAESLEGMIEMLYTPGLVNIDFADLKATLEGRGRLAYLSTVEVQGDNRADEAIRQVLQCPLYEYGISGAERIIFNISGPKSLSINEVEKISKAISDSNPRAKIIFGLSQKDSFPNKIRITLLAVGCGKKEENGKKTEISLKKKKRKKRKTGKPKNKGKTGKENDEKKVAASEEKKGKIKVKVSRTALDVKKDIEKTEKEMVTKESQWDIPAFLRRKTPEQG